MHSVVNIKLATLDESNKALLTTFVGSIIPYSFMSTYFPFAALKPLFALPSSNNFAAINEPSYPAFSAILIKGIRIAFCTILTPASSPSVSFFEFNNFYKFLEAYKRALPPPATIPSEMAAFVAHKASVTLSLTYPTST